MLCGIRCGDLVALNGPGFLSPHDCLSNTPHSLVRCPAFVPVCPHLLLLHNRFLSTRNPNSFLAMFTFPPSNFICSYTLHPKPIAVITSCPSLDPQKLSCHLLRWRPNHIWFLHLSPGYVVQGCMHLRYCREITCHFRSVNFVDP